MTEPYTELVRLADRELELVRAGELEEAKGLLAQRAELVSRLPATPPAEARPLLEAAAALQAKTDAALERDMAQAAAELHALRRGRHAVQAYTPPAVPGAQSGMVDSTG